MEERLQKYMARCGVDSRRKCEELIARGLVEVNGAVIREPGVRIDPRRDRVTVDGRALRVEKAAYLLHYKTRGITTTVSDDLGRKTVMDCLPPGVKERVYPVGRLDRDSEGLLVLTNDGALAHYLTHPAFGVEKTYRVVARGRIPPETLDALATKGMRLGPVPVKPSRVELVRHDNDNTVVMISVAEGINREVRRIFAALGHEVKRLLRVKIGPFSLEGMKRGATRPMIPRELALLRRGMDEAGVSEADAGVDSGVAGRPRPTNPRGRPRRERNLLRGKPDPAKTKPKRLPIKLKRMAKPASPLSRIAPGGGKYRPVKAVPGTRGTGTIRDSGRPLPGGVAARGGGKGGNARPGVMNESARKRGTRPPDAPRSSIKAGKGATRHPLEPSRRPGRRTIGKSDGSGNARNT